MSPKNTLNHAALLAEELKIDRDECSALAVVLRDRLQNTLADDAISWNLLNILIDKLGDQRRENQLIDALEPASGPAALFSISGAMP